MIAATAGPPLPALMPPILEVVYVISQDKIERTTINRVKKQVEERHICRGSTRARYGYASTHSRKKGIKYFVYTPKEKTVLCGLVNIFLF